MKNKIRIAVEEDACSFIEIKNQLPLTRVDGSITRGGFLLGTDIETYKKFIREGFCLVAENEGKIVGFGIIIHDQLLQNSEIWEKRHAAKWFLRLDEIENNKLFYFEQLAFLPGNKRMVIALAYNIVRYFFDLEYTMLVTTTVKEPILNLAAIPFIHEAGGKLAGNINEQYPEIGKINSDIYIIDRDSFYQNSQRSKLWPFLAKNQINF